jgi:alpha-1,2-mannosyltransferase
VCCYRALSRPFDGDFKLHWEFARRLAAGEDLYAGGLHIPYPPLWAFAHLPMTFLPMPVAKALQFPIGLAALGGLLWILRSLSARPFSLTRNNTFWIMATALFLSSRYLIRDFAELGVNTTMVALTWFSIWLWQRSRDAWAGVSLGFAIALKCTPAIFLVYLLWKRQWRFAGGALVAATCFTLLPVLVMRPEQYTSHIRQWAENVVRGATNPDPTVGVLGPEPLQNMSLRPTLARYLMHLPKDHPGRARHPFYVDFLDLAKPAARWIISGLLLLLLLSIFWWARAPVRDRTDPGLLWECAALSLLMLLLSPITWGQHAVAVLPATFFIAALGVSRGQMPRWMLGFLGFYAVFVLVLNRDLLGRGLANLLGSYHVETFSILALLAVVIGCRRLSTITRQDRTAASITSSAARP